jgi:capsid protein
MSQIKIIRKKALTWNSNTAQKARERSATDSELSRTVKSWVSDWRSRKEVERQSAFKALTRLKQELN